MRKVFICEKFLENAFSRTSLVKPGCGLVFTELRKVVFPHAVGPATISNFFLLNIFCILKRKIMHYFTTAESTSLDQQQRFTVAPFLSTNEAK
jgi:hypothetical protein